MKKIISMILILCSTASFVNITSATSELIPTPKKAPYTESITVEFSTNEIKTKREVFNDIRTLVVSEILRLHIPAKFKRTPYGRSGSGIDTMTIGDDGKTVFETSIDDIDSLDRAIISAGLPTGTGSYIVNIPLKETTLQDIYFFKNMRDLNTLGYEVITYRDRVSKDEQYRADNISTAFKSSGNVVVLNPGDSYSYLNESGVDIPDGRYKNGTAIVDKKHVPVYAGGICGGSTAIYQGIIGNKALEVTKRNPHSEWYGSLYNAFLGDTFIKIPGLDAMVYADSSDFSFRNISNHPVIVVLNFSGHTGSKEQIYTISLPEDSGTPPKFIKKKGQCYTWNVNEKNITSCYRIVK